MASAKEVDQQKNYVRYTFSGEESFGLIESDKIQPMVGDLFGDKQKVRTFAMCFS